MASHQTTNFQLCQWEAEDEVLRTDFNSDNLKIENALSAVKAVADKAYTTENAPVVCGSYKGNNAAQRKIELGFTPKAVYVCLRNGSVSGTGQAYGGLAVPGVPVTTAYNSTDTAGWSQNTVVVVEEGGFRVGYWREAERPNGVYSNATGFTYVYVAFR